MNGSNLKLPLCWSKDEICLLLKISRNHPVLYDQNHPLYGLEALRTKAYTHISDEMKAFKRDVNPDIVRNKFKVLKNQYFIERKLKEEYRMKHNRTDAAYKPKLWCYDLMNFFEEKRDDTNKCRDVEISANVSLNENDDCIELEDSEIEIEDGTFEEIYLKNTNQEVTPSKIATRNNLNAKCLQLVNDLEKTFREINEERGKKVKKSREPAPQTFLGLMIESELSKVNDDIYDEAKWKIIHILEEASKKHRLAKNVPVQLKATPPSVMTLQTKQKQQTSNKQIHLGNGTKLETVRKGIKSIRTPNSTITKFDTNCIRFNK